MQMYQKLRKTVRLEIITIKSFMERKSVCVCECVCVKDGMTFYK